MTTKCDICNKNFSSRNTMLRHRRTIHGISIIKEKVFGCKYCNKTYKHRQSRWEHEKLCKSKDEEIKLLKLELQHAKEIIDIREKTAKEIITIHKETANHERNMHKNTIKLYNSSMNTINNLLEQITEMHGKDVLKNFILPLGCEDLHARLTLENKKQIMCSRKGALNKITELSNCINPQFNNIVSTNIKDKIMFIYCDKKKKFVKEDMETVLNDLLYYRVEDLKAILDEMRKTKQISIVEINHITELLKNIETNDEYKQSKIECLQTLLYSFTNTIKRNISNRISYVLDHVKDGEKEIFELDNIDEDMDEDLDEDIDEDMDEK